MVIPKINSAHGSDTRNIINAAIDSINAQGKSIQDLVAEGQLTPEQYADFIKNFNGLIRKGDISIDDLSTEVLEIISNGADFKILSVPRNKSVSPVKTTFIEESVNLLDKSKMKLNHNINSSGVEVANADYDITDYIPVSPGEKISMSVGNGHRVTFYGENYTYISQLYEFVDPFTFTVPENASYLRANVQHTHREKAMINRGASVNLYVEYETAKLKGVAATKFTEKSIDLSHLNFVDTPENMIDEDEITKFKAVVADSKGVPVDSTSNHITDYIAVIPGDIYTIKTANFHRISFYDKDKNWRRDLTGDAPLTFSVYEDSTFIRVNIHSSHFDFPMLNKGSEILPYVKYFKPVLKGVTAEIEKGNNTTTIKNIVEPELFYEPPEMEDVSNSSPLYIRQHTHQDYYAYYDDLVEDFPDYVTMTSLGNDIHGNEMRRYDFKPSQVPDLNQGEPELETDIKKIFITTGTHGHELVPIWSSIKMFELICRHWKTHPILEKMRFNIHFVIIPVANPYGLSVNHRHTANGVDLLRNFPHAWEIGTSDPSRPTYRGPSVLSEKEAQLIYAEYKTEEHWDYVVDFHNFFSDPDDNRVVWIGATDEYSKKIGHKHLIRMSSQLKKEYDWINQSSRILGFVSMQTTGIYYTALKDGMLGTLFETIEAIPTEPGSEGLNSASIKLGVEAFTNWLYTIYLNS